MTLREIVHAIRGAQAREWRAIRAAQAVAYSHAQLATIGANQPRKMPAFDKAFPDRRDGPPKAQPVEESLANMKAWTAAITAFQAQKTKGKPQ